VNLNDCPIDAMARPGYWEDRGHDGRLGGGGYLSGLPEDQRDELARVNAPGLTALGEYLASGEALAFLGAGVSAPLYPLWDRLISELVDAAVSRLTPKEAATCRALAQDSPEAVVEIVRRGLGPGVFREVLRRVLRVRTDPESGRSWTPVQELVCRCPFKAVVTTNYDPGIVDARMRVRPAASATGFITWEDELGLDRWRTGDVFGDAELPVLFAHGQHNRPDSVVLATTEYRRAYAGKLPQVLARLMDGHLAWLGFSFADQRIAAILREIADRTGTRIDPGGAPRHVAVMAWNPGAAANDPEILAQRAEIEYGAQIVLYPAPDGDHSALVRLLETLTDPSFPAVHDLPSRSGPAGAASPAAAPVLTAGRSGHGVPAGAEAPGGPGIPVSWVPAAEPVAHFTGRAEELARLDRWAADPQVSLIGVTAWGGAGKTALVTHWIQETGGAAHRPAIRGVFGWSFYADPSADHWAQALLKWAGQVLGLALAGAGRPAAAVLAVLHAAPVLLVLDGLEVAQEGPAGGEFGRLLDGTLREVLAGACQVPHRGLVVLTSRFPFADLETFDGDRARMLDVPPFTPAEGAGLLAAAGGDWLPENERRGLVAAVDGHALATGVLAGLLAGRPPASDLAALRTELASAARTDVRVSKVLGFYADRLAEPDRYLLAAVCLFARPVEAGAVLAVAAHEVFGGRLAGWTPAMAEAADALRVVEAIELLLDAGHWQPADDLYRNRSGDGDVWRDLPAARLGQRAATAFVATPARRAACATYLTPHTVGLYLNDARLYAMNGDYLTELAVTLPDLADCALAAGDIGAADRHATEAITHRRSARLGPRPLRRPGRSRPHPRRPGRVRRHRPGFAVSGPRRGRRRTAPGHPPPPALARTRRVSRPCRPGPCRRRRPGLGWQGRRAVRPAGAAGPGS
jgi:SIR2-like protein